jgi:hypothetical protein
MNHFLKSIYLLLPIFCVLDALKPTSGPSYALATVRAVRKNTAVLSVPSSSKDPKSTAPPSTSIASPIRRPYHTYTGRQTRLSEEFVRTSTAAPRHPNHIAQAPPELSALARKASAATQKSKSASTKSESVLSPAQALQMAAAREAAVAHYLSGDFIVLKLVVWCKTIPVLHCVRPRETRGLQAGAAGSDVMRYAS